MEAVAFKKAPASASWYIDGHNLYYSYNGANKFVDNLFVVSKIIQLEVESLINSEKSNEDFIRDFSEEHDVQERRKQAREILGVNYDSRDMELINKKYKDLAKEHHPDMPNGNLEKFKQINNAHKTLKRELE
ncbi:J domain-containing protein [Candidatus Woesearchaeota archaeon]|nr:J domain-containing protein [Candidatus Woesearchaeota archaeon]